MKKKDSTYVSGIRQGESSQVHEPVMAYRHTGDELSEILPRGVLSDIAEYAVSEHRAGRCIPHTQVVNAAMMERGWK